MKVKLLRKIRKRFSIYYNPDGIMYSGVHFNNKYFVQDKNNPYMNGIYHTKQECIDWIMRKVRRKYGKNKNGNIKIWYNK